MPGSKKTLLRGLSAVAALLVPISLLGQGCEKRRTAAPAKLGGSAATVVTDADFTEFTANGVAFVDFWSPRCPPCRAQGPIVEKLANDLAGKAAIGKLRVDRNPAVPGQFAIRYIPTLIVFKGGEEVKRFTGLQNEATLVAALEEALRE